MVQRTLDNLPHDLLAHARLCAVIASRFRPAEIQGVLGELDNAGLGGEFFLDGQAGIRRLIAEGILSEQGNGWIGFRVGMLRDVLEHTTPGAVRLQVHQAAVRFYLEPGHEPGSLSTVERLPRLALHCERAGLRAEAAQLYLALAERCSGRHAYLEAESMYSSALDQMADTDDGLRLRALRGRGVVRYRITRHDDALADLRKARELAGRTGDRELEAHIVFDAAMALDWLCEWTESRRIAEQARDLMAGGGSPLLEARLAQALGRSACRFNNYAEGIELLEQAARIAEPLGEAGYEIVVVSLVLAGFVLPFVGRLAEAERCLDRVIALCQGNGDELHLGAAHGNRLCLWIATNDRDRLVADFAKVIVHARRLGNLLFERNANVNAAYFFHWRGEPDVAEPYVHRAIELNERFYRFGYRPDAVVLLARVRWARGDDPGCRALVAEVRDHQDRARRDNKPESLLAPNDQMLLEVIALAVDGGTDAEWDAVLERAHKVAEGQELVEVLETRAVVAERAGDPAAARQALEDALAACERIPSLMTDRIRQRLAESR
jgi:tetratricopeptide (TPR) repeat protein